MKGGSGKSTAAMCLAACWMTRGLKAGVVDADTSMTAARWAGAGEALADLSVRSAGDGDILGAVESLEQQGTERIVIDTPGFRLPGADRAVLRADLIVVPIRPSPVDFQVAADTVELVSELTADRTPVPLRFLMTQANTSSVIARHMREELTTAGYRLLKAELPYRVGYSEAPLLGSTPTLYQPRGAAARDIAALTDEVDSLLGVARKAPRKRARGRR